MRNEQTLEERKTLTPSALTPQNHNLLVPPQSNKMKLAKRKLELRKRLILKGSNPENDSSAVSPGNGRPGSDQSDHYIQRTTSNNSHVSRVSQLSHASKLTAKSGLSKESEVLQRLISCQTQGTQNSQSSKKSKKVSFGGVISIA